MFTFQRNLGNRKEAEKFWLNREIKTKKEEIQVIFMSNTEKN